MLDMLYRIWCVLEAIRCGIYNAFIVPINLVMKIIAAAGNAAISMLPDMALGKPNLESSWLAAVNYFFPLQEIATVFAAIVAAWILYKAITFWFRFWLPI